MACHHTALITTCLDAHSAKSATSAQSSFHCVVQAWALLRPWGLMCKASSPGQRVTACPWPTERGEGTWQQLVLVPAKSLVRGASKLLGAGCLVSRQHAGQAVKRGRDLDASRCCLHRHLPASNLGCTKR